MRLLLAFCLSLSLAGCAVASVGAVRLVEGTPPNTCDGGDLGLYLCAHGVYKYNDKRAAALVEAFYNGE